MVQHSYSDLRQFEIDPQTGCSVCKEDQVTINLPGIKPFAMCKFIANELEKKLLLLQQQGEALFELVGYRVGMTRGEVDNDFNRTEFSNHSFGIALDINSQQNGLYDRCIEFNKSCRLIRGGPWRPGYIGSLTHHGPVVRELRLIGLQWGGQIAGYQKDFMHFSPTGY